MHRNDDNMLARLLEELSDDYYAPWEVADIWLYYTGKKFDENVVQCVLELMKEGKIDAYVMNDGIFDTVAAKEALKYLSNRSSWLYDTDMSRRVVYLSTSQSGLEWIQR